MELLQRQSSLAELAKLGAPTRSAAASHAARRGLYGANLGNPEHKSG